MTAKQAVFLATLGSAALLAGAFAFQHLGGLAPCKMCIWQRWPHVAAVAIGLLILISGKTRLALFGLMAAATTSAVGVYHVGVEQKWWQGPTTCTSGSNAGLSSAELLDKIMNAPLVRCDEIAWDLLGVSMAGWNAIFSLIFAGFWLFAFWRSL